MNVLQAVLGFIYDNGYAVELLAAFSVFACWYKCRKFFVLRYLLVFFLLLSASMIWNLFDVSSPWLTWIKYIVMIGIAGGGVLFCTCSNLWDAVFCLVGGVATQHLYFRCISLILSFTRFGYESVFRMVITVALFIVVYVSVFFLFKKPLQEREEEGRRSSDRVSLMLGLAIIIVAIILHLYESTHDFLSTDPSLLSAFSCYGILCCLFTLGLEYSLFRNKALSVEKAVLEHLVEKQKEQYEHSKETIDIINVKCHDMKQHIALLESRIEPEELKEITSKIKVYETSYHTGNEVIDVFLAEKSLLFEKNKVQFNCIVDGGCIGFLKPSEIYALFGNACDNAIEALASVPEEDRIFTLSVKRQLDMAVIHMENVFSADLTFEDGLPRSTKGDFANHGFGMRSIRMVAEKYHGSVTVRAEGGIFNLNILLPLPQ